MNCRIPVLVYSICEQSTGSATKSFLLLPISISGLSDDADGTYRAVYTIKFREAVFVLHSFRKKSKSGISTPKKDMDIVCARLKVAEALAKEIGHGKASS